MKRSIKAFAIFTAIAAFAFIPPKHSIVGKWIIFAPNGLPSGEYVNIYKEGTYDVTLPGGQVGEKGYYKLDHSAFSIKNAVARACGDGYWGSYKLEFHGDDSIHFTLIEDTCANRRYDIVGVNPGLRRFKEK